MRILIVLTSHGRLGSTGKKTGFWFDEFATPYYMFRDAGSVLTLASPEGGLPPIDPRSERAEEETAAIIRFKRDSYAQTELTNTRMLSSISARDHDAAFYPGGHGPLWDLANDPHSIALIEAMFCRGRPLALVCHGPAALRYTRAPNGRPVVAGKSVTGFSNLEETAIELTDVVPFRIEDMLRNNGGNYSRKEKWQPYAVSDGDLITGQNPASSAAVANALLRRLRIKGQVPKGGNVAARNV
ncbi:type 1 glutamine amidotransferase domain-containing protein [Bradyrhizobium japonicum]|uniref:Type 1 glutamine amidotransferase domain-containing protein n=1 Tax=Bradyrhizobium japonicum TaxID=375 RepID=A0A1L3F8V3_BRAJP|nr:type 1 glutamine amidotransferase domain-containing protein [Bradyrhizobium japonicum]APG09756.1 type 1 glutamine amidotransferase domain-containing protein [Bradyrhizobium japonicum]